MLKLYYNQLKWLPAELGQLPKLTHLYVRLLVPLISFLTWPVFSFTETHFRRSPGCRWMAPSRVPNIVRAVSTRSSPPMTHIGFIRKRATEICIGLQDLELPAFVTLQIIDEAVHENSIRMWAKWELITAVKHYRDRRGVESE